MNRHERHLTESHRPESRQEREHLATFRQWYRTERAASIEEPYFVESYYHLMMTHDSWGYHYHHFQRARIFWCDDNPRTYWWNWEKIKWFRGRCKPSSQCEKCGAVMSQTDKEHGTHCYECERGRYEKYMGAL